MVSVNCEISFEGDISFQGGIILEDVISFVLSVERATRGEHEARVERVEAAMSFIFPTERGGQHVSASSHIS